VEDDRLQVAVLPQVLELHPATLTMDELIREMTGGGSRDFGEIDAIQRAVRELARLELSGKLPSKRCLMRWPSATPALPTSSRGMDGADPSSNEFDADAG
jgi:hypothetical protein